MKRIAKLLFALVIIALVVCLVASLILHDGLSATATPTRLEEFIALRARHLAIPANGRATVNPLKPTDENLQDARRHFADHCAICHANDGSGDTMMGRGMYPKPPDMRLPGTQDLSDGELYWIIEHGVRFTGMPAFPEHGDEQTNWKLVLFIRRLPALTPTEMMDMDHHNPKGPDQWEEEQRENEFLDAPAANPGKAPASKRQ